MKRTLTLLICLFCCLLLICACDSGSVDTTGTEHVTDTGTNTDTAADSSAASIDTEATIDDYPFTSPGTYIQDDTDDPNKFINIAPIDDDNKWGKINIQPD